MSQVTGLKHMGGMGALTWSDEEDDLLRAAVEKHGIDSWASVAADVPRRTAQQCQARWIKALRRAEQKGPWTPEEDAVIMDAVAAESGSADKVKWTEVAKGLPGRIGKQCRERYFNHLDPTIKR